MFPLRVVLGLITAVAVVVAAMNFSNPTDRTPFWIAIVVAAICLAGVAATYRKADRKAEHYRYGVNFTDPPDDE